MASRPRFYSSGMEGHLKPSSGDILARHFTTHNLGEILRARRAKLSRGVDRVDVVTFEKAFLGSLDSVVRKLLDGSYRFTPYLEKLVSKGRGRPPRLIARPTVRDKLALWAIKDALHEMLPEMVPSKLPNQVIREFVAVLDESPGQSIVKVDIESFYDSIDRDLLLKTLDGMLRSEVVARLVRESINCPIVPAHFRKTDLNSFVLKDGVPQGLPISNFLAHVYLSSFDADMSLRDVAYFRYVDDILVLVPESRVNEVTEWIREGLARLGLSPNTKKSKPHAYTEKFEFLGYEVESGKVRPKRTSVDKYVRSIAALFNSLRRKVLPRRGDFNGWSDEDFAELFIEELNELITGAISGGRQYGWVFYFNESNDLSVFALTDRIIKKFARRTDLLTNDQRSRIKRCIRSVHETRHSKGGGYVRNYDSISSVSDKRGFLVRFGYISRADTRGPRQLEELYEEVLETRLHRLERDVGFIS